MVRFFVSEKEFVCDRVILSGENAAHAKVLRLKAGEKVMICDGNGMEALCAIAETDGRQFDVEVLDRHTSATEPRVRVSVYMAFPKSDKLEHVIQKATELGAYEIVTFPSVRCISRPDEKTLEKKRERWQKIAASAAEQSGRGRIPQVCVMPSYSEALQRAAGADLAIVFYENEHATTLHQALQDTSAETVSLISGPEGGFEESEILAARNAGLSVCTLGTRILRCETAPLCALSAVMYASGEF